MYIYNLYQKRANLSKIGGVADKLLYYFIDNSVCSAYKAMKFLEEEYKKNGKTIDYKNVHIRIKKLNESGLIERTKNNNTEDKQQSIRNPIYYKITSFGIFYALLNNLHKYNKKIIIEYKKNPLYEFFLFPYFCIDTIEKLDDEKIIKKIFDYLQQCCKMLDKELDYLKEIEDQGGTLSIFDFTAPFFDKKHRHDNRLQSNVLKYIQQKFNINWLNENNNNNIKIIDIVEKKKIKLTDEINELTLEIIPENEKLVVSEKQNIITEFELSKDKENPAILLKTSTDVKQYLENNDFIDKGIIENSFPSLNPRINTNKIVLHSSGLRNYYPLSLACELGYSILREIDTIKSSKERYENSLYVRSLYEDTTNLKLLANDNKFVKLVEIEKRIIDNIYKKLLKHKDNN
jgi:hypothetical protein